MILFVMSAVGKSTAFIRDYPTRGRSVCPGRGSGARWLTHRAHL